MQKIVLAPFLLIIVLLSACSGGGGSSANDQASNIPPTDNVVGNDSETLFALDILNSDEIGRVFRRDISGNFDGTPFLGELAIFTREDILLDGVMVTPVEQFATLDDGVTSITVVTTNYLDDQGNLVRIYFNTDGVTCTPKTLDQLPSQARIGDYGLLPDLECDNDTVIIRTWKLEARDLPFPDQEHAALIMSETTRDTSYLGNNEIISTATTLTLINNIQHIFQVERDYLHAESGSRLYYTTF